MKVAIIAKSSDKSREVFRVGAMLKHDLVYVGSLKKAQTIEGVEAILDYSDSYNHRQYVAIQTELVNRFPDAQMFFDWRDMV